MKRGAALIVPLLLSISAATPAAEPPRPQSDTTPTEDDSALPPGTEKTEEDEEDVKLVPYRRDTVGGHFQIGLTGAYALPFGSVSDGVRQKERSGGGFGGHLDVGYGLDRQVILGAYFEQQFYGDSSTCVGCSATSTGVGALVRYHIAQGLQVDPWISYGVGFRSLSSDVGGSTLNYQGLEWLRIGLGAEWYLHPNFGLGPIMQFGAGTMFARPDTESRGGSNWRVQFGFRAVFDTGGK